MEALAADEEVVRSEVLRAEEIRSLERVVLVVACFRSAGAAEVRLVGDRGETRGHETHRCSGREVLVETAGVHECEGLLRPAGFQEEVVAEDAVVLRRGEVVGKLTGRVDGRDVEAADLAVVELLDRSFEVRTDQRVIRSQSASELGFDPLVGGGLDVGVLAVAEKRSGFGLSETSGEEEPQTVADDAATESSFIDFVELVIEWRRCGARRRVPERGLVGPAVVGQTVAERSAELVAARLGDRVDHAACEVAVLGRDAGSLDCRLLDRVLDEEVVRLSSDAFIDDGAVDGPEVVVRVGARDRKAVDAIDDAWCQCRGCNERAADRQILDEVGVEVRLHFGRLHHGRSRCGDGDRLGDCREAKVRIDTRGSAEGHARVSCGRLHAFHVDLHGVLTGRETSDVVLP